MVPRHRLRRVTNASRLDAVLHVGDVVDGGDRDPAQLAVAARFRDTVTGVDHRLLVVVAEFGPPAEVVGWVDDVLAEHADTDAVLLTHGYLKSDGTRMQPGDPFHPDKYQATRGGHDGEAWWPALRRHRNLRAIFCGHQIPGPLAYRVDAADAGHGVIASFQNWQMDPDGGGGRIRLVE